MFTSYDTSKASIKLAFENKKTLTSDEILIFLIPHELHLHFQGAPLHQLA